MKKTVLFASLVALQIQNASAQSWQMKQSGLVTNRSIVDIAAPDGINAYGMAYDVNDWYHNLNEITVTHNGGATWSAQSIKLLKDHRIMGLGAAGGNAIHVVAWNPDTTSTARGGKVVRSMNGGTTWTVEATNAFTSHASFPDDIKFLNANDGVMFGDPVGGSFEIYTTGNGGNTWTKVPANKIPPAIISATQIEMSGGFLMERFGNTFVTVTTVLNSNDYSLAYCRLLQSDDKGKTWYVKNSNLPVTGLDITMKFRNKNVGLLKNDHKLYRTINGGTTWTQVNYTGRYCEYDLDDVPGKAGWWISTGGDVMPPYTFHKGSSISYDDGNTWKAIDTTVSHSTVEMTDFSHGYSGGISTNNNGKDGVYVYRSLNPFKSAVEEEGAVIAESEPAVAFQLNVYPNPSSDSFSLALNSPAARFAFLRVINAQGAVVSSQRIVPVGTVVFGADLAAGVYIAEIIIDGNKNTVQIVKQ